MYVSRTQSGSRGTALSRLSSSCLVLVAVVIFFFVVVVGRHRIASQRGDREANRARASITVVGYDRGDTQCLVDEKNSTDDAEEEEEQEPKEERKREKTHGSGPQDREGGARERRFREMHLAFRDLVPLAVYRSCEHERTCARMLT